MKHNIIQASLRYMDHALEVYRIPSGNELVSENNELSWDSMENFQKTPDQSEES